MQEQGHVKNDRAYKLVNDAILKAREQSNPGTVTSHSQCTFHVMSASRDGVVYIVTLVPGRDGLCTCNQIALYHICWHIAASLLTQGVTEDSMRKCLGAWWGSVRGGYAAWAAPCTHVQPCPPQDTMSSDDAGAHVMVNPTTCSDKPSAPHSQTPTNFNAMLADLENLHAQHPNLKPAFEFILAGAYESCMRVKATASNILAPTIGTAMFPNPDAPAGGSLKRKIGLLEHIERECSKKSRKKPAHAGTAPPFLPPAAKKQKPRNVMARLRQETAKASAHATTSCQPDPVALRHNPPGERQIDTQVQVASNYLGGGQSARTVLQPCSQLAPQLGMLNPHLTAFPFLSLGSILPPPQLAPMQPNFAAAGLHLPAREATEMSLQMPPSCQPTGPPSMFLAQNPVHPSITDSAYSMGPTQPCLPILASATSLPHHMSAPLLQLLQPFQPQ